MVAFGSRLGCDAVNDSRWSLFGLSLAIGQATAIANRMAVKLTIEATIKTAIWTADIAD